MFREIALSLLDCFFGSLDIQPEAKPLIEPFCQCCSQPFDGQAEHTQFCTNCRGMCWKFRHARAPFLMEGDVREIIHQFKYRNEHWLRRVLGEWIYQTFLTYFSENSYAGIVPVPLSAARLKKRGFNQAWELALYLSKKTHIPLCDCLIRLKDNNSQAGLSRYMRIRNVRGIFSIKQNFIPLSGQYLLIDDVLTTGSTCSACASVLKKNGATEVDVLTAARA